MRTTRRAYLAAVGATATVGLAGCTGAVGSGGTGGDGSSDEHLPAPVAGNPDADVTVMVFEDYACPHCATYSLQVFPELRSEYVDPGHIRYEQHDLPIPVDSTWSWAAASAARAVQDTVGDDAYFEYAHALFENQDRYSMSVVADLAEPVGAPPETVREAAEGVTYRATIEADKQRGIDMGAQGTPAVFVNGQQPRSPRFEDVSAAIEAAL